MKKVTIAPVVVLAGALFMVLAPSRTGAIIELHDFRFDPAQVSIRPGEAITFENVSGTTHNITCLRCGPSAGDIQPDLAKRLTFAKAGVYTLACRYHADRGMGMRLIVGRASAPSPAPSPSPS